MTRRDFSKHQRRENVAKRGFEPAKGGLPLAGTPRPKPSKEQLRLSLDEAMSGVAQIKRMFRCGECRYKFMVPQPIDPPYPPVICPRCGGDV